MVQDLIQIWRRAHIVQTYMADFAYFYKRDKNKLNRKAEHGRQLDTV